MPDIRLGIGQKPPIRIRMLPAMIPTNAAATVGTVTTLAPGSSATVVNSGTPQNPVLDFGIPRGAPGIVSSVVAGPGVGVDSSDPANPVVSVTSSILDGDKGDVVVSGSGAVWSVENLAFILSRQIGGAI